ncbi:MAG: winged helix-turn-helix domain-containing protein [Candidatus Aenigmarchaeota archaeon]|nr:winged helix-turn-helix domain-containing protein [Candidatus Aenigmarchaeota archaeon]
MTTGRGSAKKTSREVVQSVIESLKKGPKSIYEVAGETGTTWDSVRKYLEMLEESGIAVERAEGNKRVFTLKSCTSSPEKNSGTLFGIPIKSEQDNLVNFLFMKIRETWKEKTTYYPNKTQVQKLLVDIVQECNLDVPLVWYRFGELCLKLYDPTKDYSYTSVKNESEINECINRIVEKEKDHNSVYMRKGQYIKSKNLLYLRQFEFEKNFGIIELNDENKLKIRDILMEIGFNFKLNEETENAAKILNDFISTTIYMLKTMKSDEINELRTEILDTMRIVWDMITTYNLFESLLKIGYDKNTLKSYLDIYFIINERLAIEYVSYLRDLCKVDELKETEFKEFEKYRTLMKIIEEKKTTKDERRKIAEEFAKEDTSNIFRKLDI